MSPSAKLVGIIGECEENIRKLNKLMKHKLYNTMEFVIIILLVMVIAIILYFHFYGAHVIMLSDESMVITFVGILATFIVVGNAQQVREVKTDMHEELRERREDLNSKILELRNEINDKYGENRNQIGNLSTDLSEEQKRVNEELEQLRKTQNVTSQKLSQYKEGISADVNVNRASIDTIEAKIEDNIKLIEQNATDVYTLKYKYETVSKSVVNIIHSILILNADDTSKLLLMLLFQNKTLFKIQLDNGGTTQAVIAYENDNLLFRDVNTGENIDNNNILKVEDLEYSSARVLELYGSIKKLISDESDVSPVDEHTTDTIS